jgi:hypothetical protein
MLATVGVATILQRISIIVINEEMRWICAVPEFPIEQARMVVGLLHDRSRAAEYQSVEIMGEFREKSKGGKSISQEN